MDTTFATFPYSEYKNFQEGLNRYPAWLIYPQSLRDCLRAAVRITKEGGNLARHALARPLALSQRPPRPAHNR